MKYSYLAIGAALTCATNSALAAPEKAWITVEAHAMAHYQKQQKHSGKALQRNQSLAQQLMLSL